MKEQTRQGDKREWAHYKSVTAKGAWDWKVVVPDGPQLCLSHAEYTLAARLSLGLQPFPAHTRAQLPEHCPLCMHCMTGKPVSLHTDQCHWLTCPRLINGELSRRHNAVVDATARFAWLVGAQVQREVKGLDPNSKRRPDLQIVFPGRMMLADVVVSHSLTQRRSGPECTDKAATA